MVEVGTLRADQTGGTGGAMREPRKARTGFRAQDEKTGKEAGGIEEPPPAFLKSRTRVQARAGRKRELDE
jgi:hypothetical protein